MTRLEKEDRKRQQEQNVVKERVVESWSSIGGGSDNRRSGSIREDKKMGGKR